MENRFYRERHPIGIGSHVCRFSPDGESLITAQIVKADESLRPGVRWIVFTGEGEERWHSATILRELRDWEHRRAVEGANEAILALRKIVDGEPYERSSLPDRLLRALGSGEIVR